MFNNSQQTVCFIWSTVFSGSTILGNILNESKEVTFLGEINRLSGVFLDYRKEDEIFNLSRVTQSEIANINGKKCEFWTEEFLKNLALKTAKEAYLEICQKTGTKLIIDDSKYADWLPNIIPQIQDNIRVINIILARNPLAWFSSYHKEEPNHSIEFAMNLWCNEYMWYFKLLNKYSLPYLVIRHEDLTLKPHKTLKTISSFLGISFTINDNEEQISLNFQSKNYALGGNHISYINYPYVNLDNIYEKDKPKIPLYKGKKLGGWVSDSWKETLDSTQIKEIINHSRTQEMATLLGYDLS